MLRYVIIAVLVTTCHVKAQANDNTDEQTLEWIKNNFPQNNENDQNGADPNPATKKTGIRNTSLSKPAETSNKFDNEINTTPAVDMPCETENGVSGVCVLYYLCDQNTRKVIGDGTHLIDVRYGGPCPHYLDICCQLDERVTPSEEANVVNSIRPTSTPTPAYKPDQKRTESLPKAPSTSASKECGWNNPDLFVFQPASQDVADRGVYANYGDFPWMVALLKKTGTSVWVQNDYIGGGSLIHPSVVMTAYHKLLQVTPEELKCRAGEWDTQTDKEQHKIQERDADRFVSHPDFFRTSVYNDIALIFLKSPFDLAKAPHIGTACLSSVLPDRATCFSMGWGKDIQTDEYVNILKKIKLPLVEHKTCETQLHTNTRFRHIPKFVLHESLTCAGGEEHVDTCQGDGGSSLVCPIGHRDGKTRYAVVGMVAYGLACGKKDVPGVYVNVPHLYSWVQREMAAAGYDNTTYSF
ncbi:phenoloxidase-activating factor 2-like isoform X2 [Maniola jurtina]|uniref:phenoloxidase-activating factor 2-like isoform X2 n=1 Tax=Maniola jurtina TaxID=191418 RepID=UPI001E68A19E|nr:phenoloxidase-activating factor 2-like isoform X2 [Maniola jurtina]